MTLTRVTKRTNTLFVFFTCTHGHTATTMPFLHRFFSSFNHPWMKRHEKTWGDMRTREDRWVGERELESRDGMTHTHPLSHHLHTRLLKHTLTHSHTPLLSPTHTVPALPLPHTLIHDPHLLHTAHPRPHPPSPPHSPVPSDQSPPRPQSPPP